MSVSFMEGIFRKNVKLTYDFIYISLSQKLQNLQNVLPMGSGGSDHFY